MNVKLEIPLEPMGCVRMTQRGKYIKPNARRYLAFKEAFKLHAKNQYKKQELMSKPLDVQIVFYMPIPGSWSKKKRYNAIGKYHRVKPDLDNLIKSCYDSLNQVIWKDDNQVCKTTAIKIYSLEPKIRVYIKEIDDEYAEASCLP